jgi:type IX secretion system PorP/SprF family membrane protein
MKKTAYTLLILLTINQTIKAQDPVFTQFLLIPETLNPAFTGAASSWNAGLVHRRQWPDGNRKIETQYGFVNNLVTDNVGVGITILNQRETFTDYNYFQFNAAFSYRVNLTYDWRMRLGLEAGLGRKDFNFGNLFLEDQININNGSISGPSIDPAASGNNTNINFADFSFGILFDSENAWYAATLKHLTRPDIAFNENNNVPLDLFLTVHGGYYLELNKYPSMVLPKNSSLLFSFNYMRQSQFNRLDLGMSLEMAMLSFGLIAATNPEKRTNNSHFLTSLNPFIAMKTGEFKLGYSYDINTTGFGQNQGVHELSLTWQSTYTCRDCTEYRMKLKDIGW